MAAGASGILGSLRILVDADTSRAQATLRKLGGMGGVIGGAIGTGLGVAGVAALKIGDQYNDAVKAIRIGTGATGEQLSMLEGDFKAVAGRVPQDLATVGQAIADVNTRTGQTGEGLQALTTSFLDMSRLLGGDVSSNIESITRLYGDWSVAAEDQLAANDLLLRASQATGIAMDQLAQQMVQYGAPLRNLGFSFEEGAAMLSKWEKEGVNTVLALGGLKQALGKFAQEGRDVEESTFALFESIRTAEDATWAMAEGVTWFGKRAGPDMVAAIREGRFEFQDFADQLASGTETISGLSADTRTFADDVRAGMNQIKTFVGPVTDAFAGVADAMGNAIFLLPAFAGAIGNAVGRGLGSLKNSGVVKAAAAKAGMAIGKIMGMAMASMQAIGGAIARSGVWGKVGTLAGGRFGKAFGIAAAAAMAVIILAEIQELIRIRDANFAAAAKIDEDTANWLATAPSKAEAQAELDRLKKEVKGVDGLKGAIDSLGDLGEGNVLGSGLEFIFGANPAETVNNKIRAIEGYLESGQAELANTMASQPPLPVPPPPQIAKGITEEMKRARAAIAEGFGSIKDALKNPPQLISKQDRIENMEARYKKVMQQVAKAVQANDPINTKYWTKAAAKQAMQIDKMKGKSNVSVEAMKKEFRNLGLEVPRQWRKVSSAAKTESQKAKTSAVTQTQAAVTSIEAMDLTSAGTNLMQTWANGIRAGISAAVQAATEAAQAVKDVTAGESPPPKGPLSTIDKGGANVIDAWLGGMLSRRGRAGRVGAALGAAVNPMVGIGSRGLATAAIGGGGDIIQVGTLVANDYGIDALETRMRRRRNMRDRKRRRDFETPTGRFGQNGLG